MAAAALLLALGLRTLIDPFMAGSAPYVTLFGAVALAAWVGGYRAALAVAGLGYVACELMFVAPRAEEGFSAGRALAGLAAYGLSCTVIVALGEAMRRAQRRGAEREEALRLAFAERGRLEARVRRMTVRLWDADRRVNALLGVLAHELRNPLTLLAHTLEVLKRDAGNRGLASEALETLERQLGPVLTLLDDLVDLSRIGEDRLELSKGELELRPVIEQALRACGALVESAGHELRVLLPAEPIHVHADGARLAQVFARLLHNACKYTPPGGRITISAERREGEVVVAVEDNGIGIPPDRLDSVFGRFEQADRSREGSQGGLGVGLKLVKRLVQLHDGVVQAHSDGRGLGSRFVVRLPALEESRRVASAPP